MKKKDIARGDAVEGWTVGAGPVAGTPSMADPWGQADRLRQ
jgi:hypothetical protein